MPHTFRFVDKIDPSLTVRLDLNDLTTWTLLHEGTEFTPPPIRRAEVSTMLMDGERYPSSAYGNRELQLNLMVGALSADLVAAEVQKLQRELDRPQNILEWKPASATAPVFFRTFRSPPNSIREWRGDDGRKGITVNVMAEPFAYGLRETLSPVTVNNDPAAGSNGMFLDVTGVKGDVETPAFIELPSVTGSTTLKSVVAIRRRGTPSQAPFLLQAEAMTAGTNTTIQANDANFSGSGQNWMRCTFATATMQTRLDISGIQPWPGLASIDFRGTYRVFVRVRRNDAVTTAMRLRMLWGVAGLTFTGDTVSSWTAGSTAFTLLELGKLSLPTSMDPVNVGPSGAALPVRGLAVFELQAERVSGTANLDIDYLLFVPADDRYLVFDHPVGSTTANNTIIDGYNDSVHEVRTATVAVDSAIPHAVVGRFPLLSPNETNRIYFLRKAGAGGDVLTETTAITVSYWPLYAYVKPATT